MASWKRSSHFVGRDGDGEASGNKSKRRQGDSVPTQFGATFDKDKIKGDNKLVERIFRPMIRRVVEEEVTAALGRHLQPWLRPSGPRKKTLQLRFTESPGDTHTRVKVKGKNRASVEVALYQCDAAGVEDRIVTEGPLSSIGIKLCILHGSFGSKGREDWSSEDFRRNILNLTRKEGQLLYGKDQFLRLRNGVCTVENLFVNDISTWAKTERFRLGAEVAEPTPETENIREGISQPFRVRDFRGLGYQKPDTPSLNNEIWRLEGIRKDGIRHKLLQSKGIDTVEAFLHRINTDSNQLKQELGKNGVGEKTWRKLTRHATKACAKQDARQLHLATARINSEPEQLVPAGQDLPQHELALPATPQGLGFPSTSQWHSGEAVHAGPLDGVSYGGGDVDDFNYLAFLNPSAAHEGHISYESSWPNLSNRGGGSTIWSQIRNVFKAARTWLNTYRARRKGKFVPPNC